MKWRNSRESSNVDDRRGMSGGKVAAGGGIIGVIVYLIYTFLGGGGGNIDPSQIPSPTNQTTQLTPEQQAEDDERAKFVKVVLAETEDVWNKLFREQGLTYQEPVLVLFRDQVESTCGFASAATGPFYCLSEKMSRLRQQLSEEEYNRYSVKMELQADFLAGVWAHHAQKMKNILDPGDIEEALTAANAIGDDRLQKQSTGRVVPDAFTHGTSAQRMYWFKKGFETGDIRQGDTFNDPSLN